LRTGVLEASTRPCAHCEGTGLMRTAASAGLSALRILEDEAARGRGERICLRAGREAAVYVLNKKRAELADIEQRYGVMIEVLIDESFEGARMTVESSGPRPVAVPRQPAPVIDHDDDSDLEELEADDEAEGEEDEEEAEPREAESEGERQGRKRRRRRRGGRGRGRREGGDHPEADGTDASEALALEAAEEPVAGEQEQAAAEEPREGGRRRRRRRGRGGAAGEGAEAVVEPDSSPMVERPIDEEPPIADSVPVAEPEPAAPKRGRRKKAVADTETELAVAEPAPAEAPPAETAEQAAPTEKPARKRRSKKADAAAAEPEAAPVAEPIPVPAANNDTADESGEPRRSGWWQRTFG